MAFVHPLDAGQTRPQQGKQLRHPPLCAGTKKRPSPTWSRPVCTSLDGTRRDNKKVAQAIRKSNTNFTNFFLFLSHKQSPSRKLLHHDFNFIVNNSIENPMGGNKFCLWSIVFQILTLQRRPYFAVFPCFFLKKILTNFNNIVFIGIAFTNFHQPPVAKPVQDGGIQDTPYGKATSRENGDPGSIPVCQGL